MAAVEMIVAAIGKGFDQFEDANARLWTLERRIGKSVDSITVVRVRRVLARCNTRSKLPQLPQ